MNKALKWEITNTFKELSREKNRKWRDVMCGISPFFILGFLLKI